MARKPTDTVQLKLRFSEALRRRLEREAKRQERSLNAEIIGRLEQSFTREDRRDLIESAVKQIGTKLDEFANQQVKLMEFANQQVMRMAELQRAELQRTGPHPALGQDITITVPKPEDKDK